MTDFMMSESLEALRAWLRRVWHWREVADPPPPKTTLASHIASGNGDRADRL